MSSRSGWVPVDTEIGTALFDICYLAFLFIGVVETGPPLSRAPVDLTIIFAGLVGVAVVGSVLRRKIIEFSRENLIAQTLFFGLLAWLTLSIFWAPASDTGLRRVIKSIIGLSIAFGYPLWMIGYDRERITRLLWMISGFGVSLALLFLSYDPFSAVIPNRIAVARPIGLALVILTVRAATARKRSTVLWSATILVLSLALLKNGSRAPAGSALIVSGIVGIWMIVARRPSVQSKQHRWLFGMLAAFALLVASAFFLQLESVSTIDRFTNLLQGGGKSFSYRLHYYSWSIKSWLSSPISAIIGQGVGTFAAAYTGPGAQATYPHNIFIELAISGGVIALALLLGVFSVTMRGIVSRKTAKYPEHVAILGIVMYMLINSQFTGDIYINKYLFMALGLTFISKESS